MYGDWPYVRTGWVAAARPDVVLVRIRPSAYATTRIRLSSRESLELSEFELLAPLGTNAEFIYSEHLLSYSTRREHIFCRRPLTTGRALGGQSGATLPAAPPRCHAGLRSGALSIHHFAILQFAVFIIIQCKFSGFRFDFQDFKVDFMFSIRIQSQRPAALPCWPEVWDTVDFHRYPKLDDHVCSKLFLSQEQSNFRSCCLYGLGVRFSAKTSRNLTTSPEGKYFGRNFLFCL